MKQTLNRLPNLQIFETYSPYYDPHITSTHCLSVSPKFYPKGRNFPFTLTIVATQVQPQWATKSRKTPYVKHHKPIHQHTTHNTNHHISRLTSPKAHQMTMNGFAERALHVMIPINQHFLITLYTIFEDHYEPIKASLFQILNDLCKGELPDSG